MFVKITNLPNKIKIYIFMLGEIYMQDPSAKA